MTVHDTPLAAARTRRPARSQLARVVRYAIANTAITLRDVGFVFFTVALPVVMFLIFNGVYGAQAEGAAGVGIMTNMAAYGAFGGALGAGAVIQVERANGWLRQLGVAGLAPASFVVGKVVTALVVLLPAILAVFAAGLTIGGVELEPALVARGIGVLWVAVLPMVLLGLALGLLLPPRSVQGASTLVLMALSLVGGLWFPLSMLPEWLRSISVFTPANGIGRLGTWATLGGELPTDGIVVLGVWTLVLLAVCAALFRSAARRSHR